MASGGERMSTNDFKRKREIDEARKNGTLPPEQDAEGNLINPHNPEYISKRPWYLGDSGPSLKHQSLQHKSHLLSIHEADDLHLRGRKAAAARQQAQAQAQRTKWRKGACKNCGAMGHKTLECVERPRKVGAWKTNDVTSDTLEVIDVRSQQFGKLAFDAKRDQWLGYDPREHDKTIERYDKIDAARRTLRMDEVNRSMQQTDTTVTGSFESAAAAVTNPTPTATTTTRRNRRNDADASTGNADPILKGSDSDSDSDYDSDNHDSEDDEAFRDHDQGPMFTDRVARQGGVGGAQMKTTVRNLRIREDTAKYLRNLNPNSAYYDPKSRAMRDNPNPELQDEDTTFTGDNAARFTGDATRLASAQLFAWEAYAKGTDIHPLANPSQAELLKSQFEAKKAALEREKSQQIVDRYGSQAAVKAPARELLLAQTEQYVEYARDGRVVKGLERAPVRSKYQEDQLEHNHTSIWGSWFDVEDKHWGYSCCHQKVRKSYCTGDAGKVALAHAAIGGMEPAARVALPVKETVANNAQAPLAKRSDLYGENIAPTLDEKKLKKAMKKAKTKTKTTDADADDDRTRKYNSSQSHDVNAEEMEAYKLLRTRGDDPMAKLLGAGDALLEDEEDEERGKKKQK